MAQKTVNTKLAFGIAGEFYDSSLKRSTARKLAATAEFGKPLYFAADGTVTPTYNATTAATFAGLMVNPKEHINTSANLASTMKLDAGKTVGVADVGRVIVTAKNAVKVGDKVWACVTKGTGTGSTVNYDVGDLCGGTAAPTSTAAAGGVFIQLTDAMFDIVDAAAGEPAVVTLDK